MSAYSQTLGRTNNIKSAMSEMGMNANEMGMRWNNIARSRPEISVHGMCTGVTKEEKTSRRDNVLVFYGRLMEKYQTVMNRMQIGEK